MERIKIEMESMMGKDIAAHLRPVIEFIKGLGNEPDDRDEFSYDQAGSGHYRFKKPLDRQLIESIFAFPRTIVFGKNGDIYDLNNALHICGGMENQKQPFLD